MSDFYKWKEQRSLSSLYQKLADHPVAYFCMEYALPGNLPIYAGGLGVLAGDYVMEAEQQNFPMVAVGLFYNKKCYSGSESYCVKNIPEQMDLKPLLDISGKRIKVSVPIGVSSVYAQVWIYNSGTIPVYLLDTNVEENSQEEREITDLLYVVEPEKRIRQELILGIGGAKLLHQLNIEPSIYHMNEGHSAFLFYEVTSRIMEEKKCNYSLASKLSKDRIAFTNHTLVVGGHDVFDLNLIKKMLKKYANENDLDIEKMLASGLDKKNKKVFSTTFLALNSAGIINGVSKLHSQVARKHWPDYDTKNVTNGVNLQRWDRCVGNDDIVSAHAKNKKALIGYIKKQSGVKWRENDLIIGWARRIVSYKRPTSLFENISALKKITQNKKEPLRILFSGQPHYDDSEGGFLINQLQKFASDTFRGNMVFLDKYSTSVSELMVCGCDIWLNTPIVGLEACGTSGMKAALNGVLQCSTNDGWLPEVDLEKIGFKLDDKYISLSLIDTISNHIVPLYYQHLRGAKMNSIWKEKMEWSRENILHKFGSDRMLRDYIELVYKPLLAKASN